jgi:GNAT superfamily N-acetyltransferase
MTRTEVPLAVAEAEYYYLHVPRHRRAVSLPVTFVPVAELLQDEETCKALWHLLSESFRTRSKFLAIWPSVRFIALHGRGKDLKGALLVSAPVNWQIDYVVVRPDQRGRGVAAALVNEAVNHALARGVTYVMLTSRASLRPLYEGACGFSVVGGRDNGPGAVSVPSSAAAMAESGQFAAQH